MMSAPSTFDPTLLNDALSSLRQYIFTIITDNGGNSGPFAQFGLNLFSGLATIMIVIAGIKIVFRADESFHKLGTLLAIIMCVWAMVMLYTRPSDLFGGYSFSQIIPKGAFALADTIGVETKNALFIKLNQIADGVSQGSAFSLAHLQDGVIYLAVTLLIAILELAMFIVIAFGYIALGACLIVGPILIPFLLVPKLDFLFWGWLKSTLKYSMYPLIGNIVILVVCRLMLSLLNTPLLEQQLTNNAIAVHMDQIPLLTLVFIAGIFSIFKTPSLVSDIFSGSSTSGHGVQQAVSSAISAVIL